MTDADAALLEVFAKILRKRRITAGLSQEELAHRAGVSMRYVSLLESRRHQPSLGTIYRLCGGLGVSMGEFINTIEDELSKLKRGE